MKREVRPRERCPECSQLFLHVNEHIRLVHGPNDATMKSAKSPKKKSTKIVIGKKKGKSTAKPNPFVDTDSNPDRRKSSSFDRTGMTLNSSFMKSAIHRAMTSDYDSPMSVTEMEGRLDAMDDTGPPTGHDGPEADDEVNVQPNYILELF